MSKNKIQVYTLFLLFLIFMGCDYERGKSFKYIYDITLINHNGKPIPLHYIYTASEGKIPKIRKQVDSNGNIVFEAKSHSDADTHHWSVFAESLDNIEPINCITSDINFTSQLLWDDFIIRDTIRFDTFAPFPIQIKTKRKDVLSYKIEAFTKGPNNRTGKLEDTTGVIRDKARASVNKNLFQYSKNVKKSQIDTTFTFDCLSKTFFLLRLKCSYQNAPFDLDIIERVYPNTPRNKPFLIEL